MNIEDNIIPHLANLFPRNMIIQLIFSYLSSIEASPRFPLMHLFFFSISENFIEKREKNIMVQQKITN